MSVSQSTRDKQITGQSHRNQHDRADRNETKHASQHNLGGPDRLGNDRINGLTFDVGRQREGADEQGQCQDQIVGRSQHKADIQPRPGRRFRGSGTSRQATKRPERIPTTNKTRRRIASFKRQPCQGNDATD